jgi:hypothetical protein
VRFFNSLFQSWIPLGIAFVLGTVVVGGVAIAHPGSPSFLHSGHSDTMNGTLTAKNFKYKSPKTVRLVVPGSAFIPESDASTFEHGGYSGEATPTGGSEMVAPVELPHGARVVSVRWFYDENAAVENAELHLEANNLTGDHADMALLLSDACATTPCPPTVDTSISPNTINNRTRHYGLWLDDLSDTGDVTTYKVVITYRVGAPGPAASRPLPGATFTGRVSNHN